MKAQFRNILDNVQYPVDEGSVIVENKNETLDSAEVCISNLSHTLNLEPLDSCVLIDEQGRFHDRYMCVASFDETMLCVNPKTYMYRISLVSETKKLEGVLLPNISVTPGTGTYNSTIGGCLRRMRTIYFERRRTDIAGSIAWALAYDYAPEVLAYFDQVPAVEMQWNAPTLREVLTDLMMVRDRIPVLRNGVISMMDLTEKGSDRSEDPAINYVERSNYVDSYVSSLRMGLSNAMQTENATRMVEWLPFTSDDYVVTSDNCLLRTSHPILRIRSLRMVVHWKAGVQDGEYSLFSRSADLCSVYCKDGVTRNCVYEADEYRALERIVSDSLIGGKMSTVKSLGKYQNSSVYYQRGGTEIGGFSNLTETRLGLISTSKNTWNYLANLILGYGSTQDEPTPPYDVSLFDDRAQFQQIFFEVEYETLASLSFDASKGDYPRNKRVVADNQTNAWVNADAQGFLEYQKANRLGNLILRINARYETFADMISIGDSYGDSVVYSCRYQVFKDHIEANAEATKGYVLRNYFTGVKSKIRSWRIVSDAEAFERREIRKYVVELSTEPYEEAGVPLGWAKYLASGMLVGHGLNQYKVKGAFARFDRTYPSVSEYYQFDVTPRIVGNSMVFAFGAKDNYSVGKGYTTDEYVEYKTSFFDMGLPYLKAGMGGLPMRDLRYVDGEGYCALADVVISWESPRAEIFSDDAVHYYATDATQAEIEQASLEVADKCEDAYRSFVSDAPSEGLFDTLELIKDNKEIISFSIQFEYCSNGVGFTKDFIRKNEMLDGWGNNSVKVYVEGQEDAGASVSLSDAGDAKTYCAVTISLSAATEGRIEVKNEDGDLLVSLNGNGTASAIVYFNLLRDRDKAAYDSQGNIVKWHDGSVVEA